MLRTVRTVIVDEIHAVADDKRGSHLALSLARLDRLVEQIGGPRPSASASPPPSSPSRRSPPSSATPPASSTSATAAPWTSPSRSPRDELGAVATNEMWDEIYDRAADLIRENRTTLVFVNTRRLSERVAHHLAERLGENAVLPHHGSLSPRAAPGSRAPPQRTASCAPWWPPPRSNSASISARSTWSARSARRAPSPSPCSASAAPATGWARCPRAASSPPPAMS